MTDPKDLVPGIEGDRGLSWKTLRRAFYIALVAAHLIAWLRG